MLPAGHALCSKPADPQLTASLKRQDPPPRKPEGNNRLRLQPAHSLQAANTTRLQGPISLSHQPILLTRLTGSPAHKKQKQGSPKAQGAGRQGLNPSVPLPHEQQQHSHHALQDWDREPQQDIAEADLQDSEARAGKWDSERVSACT